MSKSTQADLIASSLERLSGEMEALAQATSANTPTHNLRKGLNQELRGLIMRAETILRDIDPIQQPYSIFNPADPAIVGRFLSLALIAQPRVCLSNLERFYGAGVYALYYRGDFSTYGAISGTETPIYVGKANPKSSIAKTPKDQGDKICTRLRDHIRSIEHARATLSTYDFDFRFLVVQSGLQGAAEEHLISLFQPIWNSQTGICYGFGKHGDSSKTRANKRSPWDTLHPGRPWAWEDDEMQDARAHDEILANLTEHFSGGSIYRDTSEIMIGFIDELRQD